MLNPHPAIAPPSAPVRDLLQQMMQLARSPSTDVRSAPAIVLVEAGIPVGVVTASDVLRWVVVEHSSSGARSVAHSMVRTAPAVLPSAGYRDLFDLLPLFQERGDRPIVITDAAGKLEGTVSFAAVCPYLPEKVLRSHVLDDVLTDPVRIQARATIREATRLVVERDGSGALVETNTGECLGAIAAVDLLRFLAGRENFSAEKLDSELPERGIRNVPRVPAKASLWEVRRDLGRGTEAIATDGDGVPLAIVEPRCLLYPFTPRALYGLTRRQQLEVDTRGSSHQQKCTPLDRHVCQQAAIASLGQQALRSRDTDALMATAVKLVANVLGVKYCAIMELLPNRAAFVLRAGTGWQRDWIGRITVSAREQSQEGYTLSMSKPVVVKDLRLETRFGGTPFLHNQGIISGASVAIAGKEASFGVLSVHSVQRRSFDEDDLHFLQAIANIIASVLERLHAEEELTNFFNLSLDMLCVTVLAEQSDRSYFRRINPQFGAILGYDEATLLSLPILEFIHPSDRAATRKEMQKLALGLPCRGFENRYRCADGTYRWLSWTAIPSIAEEGIVYAVARDVTERKQTEVALKSINQELEARVEERTKELQESNDKLLIEILERQQIEMDIERQAFRQAIIAELGQAALSDIPLLDLIRRATIHVAEGLGVEYCKVLETLPDERSLLTLAIRTAPWNIQVVLEREAIARETREKGKDEKRGSEVSAREAAVFAGIAIPIQGQSNCLGTLGAYTSHRRVFLQDDISFVQSAANVLASAIDRRRAEQELRRSQEFIQRVADASPNILYIYDLQEQRNIYVNREITALLGYTPSQVQAVGSKLMTTLFHPDDLANITDHHRRFDTMQEGEVVEIEYRMRDSEGNWHWFVSRDTLFARTKDGKANQIVGAASDITHRKQTEEWFRLSERAIASSSNGIVISDIRQRDRPLVFVNPAFERITGYTAIEVLGRNCRFLQGKDRNQPEVDQLRQAVKQGKSCKVILRNYRKDGSLFWNEIAISPIHDAEGNLTHYLGIQNDITAFKLAEERLRQQVKREQLMSATVQSIRTSLDLTAILNTTAREVKQLLEADRVLVYRVLDDGTGSVVAEAVGDRWSQVLNIVFSAETFPESCHQHYLHGKIYVLNNIEREPVLPCMMEFMQQFQIQAKIAVPIVQQDVLWGLLMVHQCNTFRQWQQHEIDFLQQLAAQLAIAIQQSELYEALQMRLAERQQAETDLKASLHEKELLLKEIHHRVKNNLLVVASLLELQSDYSDRPEILKALAESQHRVHSMALIHEKLYRSTNLASIDFGEYLESLAENLLETYSRSNNTIQVTFDCEPVALNIETANPCGLIVNELLSNCLKHAFPDGRSGNIWVSLCQDDDRNITLVIRDDGIGFPKDLDLQQVDSLGLELVRSLTKQIQGILEMERCNGTLFRLTFSELYYRQRC